MQVDYSNTILMHYNRLYVQTGIIALCCVLIAYYTNITLQHSYIWHGIGLQKAYNEGIAFGIHLGRFQSVIISIALAFVLSMAHAKQTTTFELHMYSFIVGGGLANVLDRIPDGLVTDMIRIGSFPIFNVADVCINIGIWGLLWNSWRTQPRTLGT